MAKFFKFCDRKVDIRFFSDGQDGVTVTLNISDETDLKFLRGAELLKEGTEAQDLKRRKELWTQAVDELIGQEDRERVMAKAGMDDCFSLAEIYRFVVDAYAGAKVKNLSASVR